MPWLVLYALIGPLPWALLALSMAFTHTRMSRLVRRSRVELPEPLPSVTVLIPAKDEGQGIRQCLQHVLALTYPAVNILAIDDRSTDQTGAVMDELSAAHPGRLRVLHIAPDGLPPGWLGKCNALHTAAAQAKGEWLLFVDSDVKVEPDSLSVALSQAVGRRYDALSIMTRLECDGFWDALLLPLCAASVGAMTIMPLTNEDARRRIAFANGQFFLIRRSVYESVGGHAAVRDNITEDVALMRRMKASGNVVRLFYGQHLASTRMHSTLRQMFQGWARIFSGVLGRRTAGIWATMAFVAISGLSVYPALVYGALHAGHDGGAWLALAIAHLALITGILAVIYRMSGNRMLHALAFPVAAALLLGIYGYALRACRTGQIAWRGTNYTSGSATDAPAANARS